MVPCDIAATIATRGAMLIWRALARANRAPDLRAAASSNDDWRARSGVPKLNHHRFLHTPVSRRYSVNMWALAAPLSAETLSGRGGRAQGRG